MACPTKEKREQEQEQQQQHPMLLFFRLTLLELEWHPVVGM